MRNIIKYLTILSVLSLNRCFSPTSEAIERIRKSVVDNRKDYSDADVDRVRTSDAYIKAMSADARDESEVIKQLETTMKWRRNNVHKEFTDTSFPLEIYKCNWVTYLGADQGNRAVFLLKLSNWHQGSTKFEQLYQEYII